MVNVKCLKTLNMSTGSGTDRRKKAMIGDTVAITSAILLVTNLAIEHHCPLTGTKLYCL